MRALKLATAALNRRDRDIAWLSTGPGLLTRSFAQRVAEAGAEECMRQTVVPELHALQRAAGVFCAARYKRAGLEPSEPQQAPEGISLRAGKVAGNL